MVTKKYTLADVNYSFEFGAPYGDEPVPGALHHISGPTFAYYLKTRIFYVLKCISYTSSGHAHEYMGKSIFRIQPERMRIYAHQPAKIYDELHGTIHDTLDRDFDPVNLDIIDQVYPGEEPLLEQHMISGIRYICPELANTPKIVIPADLHVWKQYPIIIGTSKDHKVTCVLTMQGFKDPVYESLFGDDAIFIHTELLSNNLCETMAVHIPMQCVLQHFPDFIWMTYPESCKGTVMPNTSLQLFNINRHQIPSEIVQVSVQLASKTVNH